jgi:hypothetical protein
MRDIWAKCALGVSAAALISAGGCSKHAGAADFERMNRGAVMEARSLFAGERGGGGYFDPAANVSGAPGGETAPLAVRTAEMTRKLVMRANLRIRTADPAASEKSLYAALGKYGAYAASTTAQETSRYYEIRIPAASYGALLADLDGFGKVLFKSESAEDVTVRFYDLEGRLETKRRLLETFRDYLGKAANMDEILQVERRIAELEDDIDRTGKDLRTLADLVDYATVELELSGPPEAASPSDPALGERFSLLVGSFGRFASTALLVLAGMALYGVPVVLLVTLLFWALFGRIGLLKKLWRLAGVKGPGRLRRRPMRFSAGRRR